MKRRIRLKYEYEEPVGHTIEKCDYPVVSMKQFDLIAEWLRDKAKGVIDMNIEEQESMDGIPALVEEEYISIRFQCGPAELFQENGATMERVLEVVEARLNGFQNGPFKCRENAVAITKIQEAIMWLQRRTRDRKARGVHGKNDP